jgi:molybdopterin molybdotransferase
MAGRRAWFRPVLDAVLDETLRKKPGRTHFVRVGLERRPDGLHARSTGNQSSGVLRSMVEAQALLVFAAEASELPAGARVRVHVLDPAFFEASQPA